MLREKGGEGREQAGVDVQRPRVKPVLTRAERSSRNVLKDVIARIGWRSGVELDVLPQVSLKSVIDVPKRNTPLRNALTKEEFWYLMTGVFDLLVVYAPTSHPVLAIEQDVDDRHRTDPDARRRDRLKNRLCEIADFPVHRVDVERPNANDLREAIAKALLNVPRPQPALAAYLEREPEPVDPGDVDDPDLLEPGDARDEHDALRRRAVDEWLVGLEDFGPEAVRRAALAIPTHMDKMSKADIEAWHDLEQVVLGHGDVHQPAPWDLHPCMNFVVKTVALASTRRLAGSLLTQAAYESGLTPAQVWGVVKWALLPWARAEGDPLAELWKDARAPATATVAT